ncbi:hypothetical protein Tco_0621897 [Tanacetum coccineum]
MRWQSFPCSNSRKNGNSWVPIPVTATETGPSTGLKMTVPSTAEEKICKKNDVKARSLLLMALPNEHQLTFDQYVDAQSMFAAIKARFGGNEATKKTQKALLKQTNGSKVEYGTIKHEGQDSSSIRELEGTIIIDRAAPRSKDNKNWNQGCLSKAVRIEDASEKEMCAIDGAGFDWTDMAEEEIQTNMAHMAFSNSEVTKNIKWDYLGLNLKMLRKKRRGLSLRFAKFEKIRAKDLDDLLASQVTDKSKKGFGYNVVPSPHPLILNRPTPLDLSYSGLEEFKQPEVNEYGPRDSSLKPTTGCDKESDNSKENTDDSLKQQQMTDSKKTSYVKSAPKVDKDWKDKFSV